MPNEIYDFLKKNNLTDKDETTFLKEYSDSTKARELYGFFEQNKLTTKGFDDFYGTYLKKKDWVSNTFGGGEKPINGGGLSGGRLGKLATDDPVNEKKRLADYITSLKNPEQKEYSKQPAPIVSTTNFKKNETPFDQTKEEAFAGASKKLGDIMYGDGDGWKDPIKTSLNGIKSSQSTQDALNYYGAKNLTEESLMPDGFEANRILSSTHFGNSGDDNLTAKALRKKADEYNKATQSFNEIKDLNFIDWAKKDEFYDAAAKFYAEKNPLFKEQIEAAGLPNIESNAKRGQVAAMVMSDPDFIAYATKENPNLLPLIEQVNKDLYTDNKDYGINQVANKVSRGIEKTGYNKIDPIFNFAGEGAREMADLTAQATLTPDEYKIYKENNVFEKLDMPSFFEGFASRVKQIIKSTGDTFTTLFTPTSNSVLKQWDADANHVSAEPKGFTSWIRDVGDVAGLVATIGATANITGGATSATVLNFFGQEVEAKKAEYPNKPVTAITLGATNTLLYALLTKDIFPAAKVKSAFSAVQPEIKSTVENFTSGKIGLEATRKKLQTTFKKATDFVGGTLTKNGKVTLELAGIQGVNRLLDKLAGMSDERFAEIHPDNELGSGIIHTFSTFAPISGMGKYGEMKNRNRVMEETIYNAVSKPQQTERLINEASINLSFGTVNEVKENFKIALNAKKELDALKIHPKEQKRFIFEALKEKAAKDQLEASQDPVIQKKNKEAIKESQEIKEKILNGEEADTIVTESEQKIIDEKEKNDTELERLKVDNEIANKKVDAKIEETDGRESEANRIKLQELKEEKRRINEDYEKKVAKLTPKVEEPITLDQDRDLMDEGGQDLSKDDVLLNDVRSKSDKLVALEELPFFIEQTANDPVQAIEKYGEETANTLLSKATDKQLTRAAVNLAKFDVNNPAIDILNKELERRESEAETKIEEPTVSETEGAGSSGVVDFTAKGGNKVVTEKGDPLKVYHGTNADFTDFKPTKSKRTMGGIMEYDVTSPTHFFTADKNVARNWAENRGGNKVKEVYVSIKNPLDLTEPNDLFTAEDKNGDFVFQELRDRKLNWSDAQWKEVGINPSNMEITHQGRLSGLFDNKEFVDALKEKGFDGVIFSEGKGDAEGNSSKEFEGISYGVFSASQIKKPDVETSGEIFTVERTKVENKNELSNDKGTQTSAKETNDTKSNSGNEANIQGGEKKTNTIGGYEFTKSPTLEGAIVEPIDKSNNAIIEKQMFADENKNVLTNGVKYIGGGWYEIGGDNFGSVDLYNTVSKEGVSLNHKQGGRMGVVVQDFIKNNSRYNDNIAVRGSKFTQEEHNPKFGGSGHYKGTYFYVGLSAESKALEHGKNLTKVDIENANLYELGEDGQTSQSLKNEAKKAGYDTRDASGYAESEYLKKQGYDGIKRGNEIVLFEPKKFEVKTVEQSLKETTKAETPTPKGNTSNVTAEQVRNKLQEIEKQSVKINITQDANGKMEQTSQEVIDKIKAELDKTGLPYNDVVSNDKGSTYFVVTKDGQQHEVLKVLQSGGKLVPTNLTKAKWINHLIKTEKDAVVKAVEQSLKETTKAETTTQEGNAEKVAEGGKSISDVDLEKQFFHNSAMSLATKGKEKESYQEKAAELYEKVKDNEGLSEREMEFLKKNIYNDPTKTRDENLEKYANKNENTTTQSEGKVAELEAARDMAILREKVPEMGNVNEVVPTREAVSAGSNADNLTVNKRKRADLKNRYTELQKLLGCLMK